MKKSIRSLIFIATLSSIFFLACTSSRPPAYNSANSATPVNSAPVAGSNAHDVPPPVRAANTNTNSLPPEQKDAIVISAVALSKAYKDNLAAAEAKYKSKKLSVIGKITQIFNDGNKSPTIWLEGSVKEDYLDPTVRENSVHCVFDEGKGNEMVTMIGFFNKGEVVRVLCTNSSTMRGSPYLTGCTIFKTS